MKGLLIAFYFTLASLNSSGQVYGYFGKKNTLSVNSILYTPLIYNLFNIEQLTYKKSGSGVTSGRSNLDYGYAIAFSHGFSGRFALGADISVVYGRINTTQVYYKTISSFNNPYYAYGEAKVEQLKLRSTTIMPKIEFNTFGEQLPIGINHQIGAGVTISTIKDQAYSYEVISFSSSDGQAPASSFFAPAKDVGKFYNFTMMYAFNIRKPITKQLMINYGLKYNLNVSFKTLLDGGFVSGSGANNQIVLDINEEIRQKKSTSLMSFNIGLTYVF